MQPLLNMLRNWALARLSAARARPDGCWAMRVLACRAT